MVQKEIRNSEEERRQTKAIELGVQGAWTRWDTEPRALSSSEIWKYPQLQLQFFLRSVYDVLPTPANLYNWETPDCPLCGQRGTLQHILTSCQVALAQGRYTWRHNQVLRELADILERERKNKASQPRSSRTQIRFVKEGETSTPRSERTSGILSQAGDWKLAVDLDQRLTFPDIVPTNLRPDMVLWSPSTKKVIVKELTLPWEDRCNEAHERKRGKYEALLMECKESGWQTWSYPVEVGCRGFPAQSVWRMLSALGVTGRTKRAAVQRMAKTAERSSCWVWMKKDTGSWRPTTDAQ